MEGPRQGRPRHLGDPADRLPVERPRHARLRAARLPARRVVLLVHLLADPGPLPVRARRAARDVPRGARAHRAIRSRPGRRSSRTPRRPAPTSPSAARAASCARPGTRSASSSPPRTSTRSSATGPTGSSASRRSRRCRWSPTPPGTRFLSLIGGVCLTLLRLVRRPAAGLAADLGRPDRRARVRRLVERRLPDPVGLEHPADPHAGRALHDRGALPRARRSSSSRPTTPATRSSPTTGCPPQPGTDGALAMAMGHVILKEFYVDRQTPYFDDYAQEAHRPAVPRRRCASATAPTSPTASCARRDLGDDGENAEWKTVVFDDAHRRAGRARTARSATAGARRARATGTSSSTTSTRALTLLGAHDELVELDLPRFDVGETEGGGIMRRGVPAKRIGGPARHDGLRPRSARSSASPATACRATGRPATTIPQPYTPAWQEEHTGVDAGS